MERIIKRIREPSTWAGAGVLIEAVGPNFGVPNNIGMGLAAIFGGLAMILGEKK